MASLLDLGAAYLNYDMLDESFDEAKDEALQGYGQATEAITDYSQPYVDFGTEGISGYQDLGEFQFDYDNYLGSDAYDWLVDETVRGIERGAAAGSELYSGKTLAELGDRINQLTANLYGEEYDRQLAAYDANRAYYGDAVGVGADVAMDTGATLADLALGEGYTVGALGISEAQAKVELLKSILGDTGEAGTGTTGSLEDLLGFVSGGGLDDEGYLGILGDLGGALIGEYGDDFLNFGSAGDLIIGDDGLAQQLPLDAIGEESWWDNLGEFAGDAWDGILELFN